MEALFMAEKTFIKVKYSLDNFRKKENFEKYFPGCIVRIRKNKKDLIYYIHNTMDILLEYQKIKIKNILILVFLLIHINVILQMFKKILIIS